MPFAFRALIIIQLYQALFFRREKTVTRLFAQQELSVSDHPDIYYHFCNNLLADVFIVIIWFTFAVFLDYYAGNITSPLFPCLSSWLKSVRELISKNIVLFTLRVLFLYKLRLTILYPNEIIKLQKGGDNDVTKYWLRKNQLYELPFKLWNKTKRFITRIILSWLLLLYLAGQWGLFFIGRDGRYS